MQRLVHFYKFRHFTVVRQQALRGWQKGTTAWCNKKLKIVNNCKKEQNRERKEAEANVWHAYIFQNKMSRLYAAKVYLPKENEAETVMLIKLRDL